MDTTIIARVASISAVGGIAALMVRETLDENSAYAMMALTRGSGTKFQRRTAAGLTSTTTSGADNPSLPYWVKLVRSGTTLTGYKSGNGTTWTLVGNEDIPMTSTVYVGLAVPNTTDTFDHVEVLPTAGPSAAAVIFSDDFNDGNSNGWTFSNTGYWSVVNGQLKANGPTIGNWTMQNAYVPLEPSTSYWKASLKTTTSASSHHGITASNADQTYSVALGVDDTDKLLWQPMIDGVWQGWTEIASAISIDQLHDYAIQMEQDGSFTLFFDGEIQLSGINAGPTTVWADGIGYGALFTDASASAKTLNTVFDNVEAR